MPREAFDVIVIGAGAAGENAAARAAGHGLAAAVVERELVGGDCSYWACMPSKALLRPAEALSLAQRVPGARRAVVGELDVADALSWRDAMSAQWDDSGQVEWLEDSDVGLIRGHGRLDGERRVVVETSEGEEREYRANRAVVIATGTRPLIPPIEGIDEVEVWTNREATTAEEAPESLVVVGGGAAGVELAQAWRSLGTAEVVLVEMEERLLPTEEPFCGVELAEALEEDGIDVRTGTVLEAVRPEGEGVVAALSDGTEVRGERLYVAAGRRPATDDVGLETVGLDPGSSLEVDDHLSVEGVEGGWLYAVGDVNGRSLLTHMGKYQARLTGDHIAGQEVAAWADHRATPRVVFTRPQVAAVGLTEARAREEGLEVEAVTYPINGVAGTALLGKGYRGTAKLVVDSERQVVVGATFTGPPVAVELVHAATIAVAGEVPLERLWHAVPQFPSVSEVWLRLMEAYGL